jgi:hypothetical protein
MLRTSTIILAGIASASAAALHAHDGRLDVIDRGYYACETPGDAEIGPGIAASEYDFLVISASRYRTPDGTGSYLRTADKVQMTSGPKEGEAFEMKGERFLEMTAGKGTELGIRCIRSGAPGLPLSAQRD